MLKIQVLPSLLSANFGKLQSEIDRFDPLVPGFHFDVMDGHFVPNLSMGAPVLAKLKTRGYFDVHLMVSNPMERIPEFAAAGADMVSFHIEATEENARRVIDHIHSYNMKAGIALKPKTRLNAIEHVLDSIDYVLIMSVEPGYSGQSFMPEVLQKVTTLRNNFPDLSIEIDGGVNNEIIASILSSGANMIVSASYLFGATDRKAAVESLKG
jgi:ribulose-phosphate 3-epimerase